MKVFELKTKSGDVLAKSTTPIKHSVTVPTKKTKAMKPVFPKTAKKAAKAHMVRMAERYITNKKNAGVTRRARAARIVKLNDGRKVYFKAATKQTKRSMMNAHVKTGTSVKSKSDQRAMMKMVEKITVDRLNAYRKKQMEAAGKGDKFVPTPYNKVDMHGFKGKYVAAPKPKRVVRVTNLPEKATEKQVQFALKRSAPLAKKIKISSFKSKPGKDGKTKKETFALVYTGSEHDAKALVGARLQKMKVGGNKVGLRVQAIHKMGPSKKKLAVLKKVDEDKKKRVTEMRKKNQERHEANQKRASRRNSSRRHSKFEKTRILRDPKSHHVYAIKRNNAAKAPKAERPSMHSYKKLRSLVRVSRK